ncbi:unnamed protein product [Rangifer tarandus platyrhynchus]|uniref:Uncharacterized protein n=1 Tax=Rangifer tarandus platyrhynchus TaxID=3082113 RepID=A0AC59YTZ0_RANTA
MRVTNPTPFRRRTAPANFLTPPTGAPGSSVNPPPPPHLLAPVPPPALQPTLWPRLRFAEPSLWSRPWLRPRTSVSSPVPGAPKFWLSGRFPEKLFGSALPALGPALTLGPRPPRSTLTPPPRAAGYPPAPAPPHVGRQAPPSPGALLAPSPGHLSRRPRGVRDSGSFGLRVCSSRATRVTSCLHHVGFLRRSLRFLLSPLGGSRRPADSPARPARDEERGQLRRRKLMKSKPTCSELIPPGRLRKPWGLRGSAWPER